MSSVQGTIPYPPNEFFKAKRGADGILDVLKAQGESAPLKIIERIEAPPEGGIYVYHKGVPFPQKGWPTPHALQAIYSPKRAFISLIKFLASKDLIAVYLILGLLPKKLKIKLFQRFISIFNDFAGLTMGSYYLEDKLYMIPVKALMKLGKTFLIEIGIEEKSADQFAENFGMFIEYDTAYRWRLQDILSETTAEKMKRDPAGEITRLIGLLAERDGSGHVIDSFKSVGKLITILMWIPWIRKAFIKALDSIEFKDLQLDEADHFHVRHLAGYNFFGETIEERAKKYEYTPTEAYVVQ